MKLNEKWRKRINGSVSIFLVLLLVPMFTFAGVIIDLSRMSASNVVLSGAGDLAMNAAMSDFDQQMKDIYGIFAMSAAAGNAEAQKQALTDNLRRYFMNSLTNTADLDASDSYTREYINSLCSWFSSVGTDGDVDFDTLIELGNAGFNASYVKGSEVYQPNIMRREILEYMKYRGPVSISTSLINKFSSFKGFKEQNDAVDKKVEYDKKLDEMGDKCKEAYKAIVKARDKTFSFCGDEKPNKAELEACYANNFELIRDGYSEISEMLVAYKMYSGKSVDSLTIEADDDTFNHLKDFFDESKLLDIAQSTAFGKADDDGKRQINMNAFVALELAEAFYKAGDPGLKVVSTVDSDGNGGLNVEVTPFGTFNDFKVPDLDSFNKTVSVDNAVSNANLIDSVNSWRGNTEIINRISKAMAVVQFEKDFESFHSSFFSSSAFTDKYILPSTNPYSTSSYMKIISGEGSFGQNVSSYFNHDGKLDVFIKNAQKYKDDLYNEANDMVKGTIVNVQAIYNDCNDQVNNYEDAIKKVNELKKELKKLNDARNNWKKSIDNVSDSSVKQNMQSDYDSTADLLQESDVTKFVDEVLTPNKEYFTDLRDKVKTIKYADKVLQDYNLMKDTDIIKDFIDKISAPPTNVVKGTDAVENAKKLFSMTDKYKDFKSFTKLIENDVKPSEVRNKYSNQKIFEYLIKTCGQDHDDEAEKQSKDNMKKAKKDLIESGKNTDGKGNGQPAPPSSLVDADKFSDVLNGDSKDMDSTDGDVTDKDKDSDLAGDAQTKMRDQSNFLEKIGEIAKAGGQDLYLDEYINKMFSCYTTNIDEHGQVLKDKNVEKTLSGIELSAANNKYYRGEVEYILWGGDPNSAVNKTKASIFGIRFVLNTIYAFTSPEIQSMALQWATAIAGWTAFGIPIVQAVITIGLALGESLIDLEMLCTGKSVAIYKSASTWTLSPQGLVNAAKQYGSDAINAAKNKAKEIANDKLSDLYNKIENTSVDAIGSLGDDVNKYLSDSVNKVKDSVMAATVEPFRKSVEELLYKIDDTWSEAKIKEFMDKEIDELIADIDDTDSTMGKTSKLALEKLKEHTAEIAATIYEKSKIEVAAKDYSKKMTEIVNTVEAKINTIASGIEKTVTDKINDLTSAAQKKVKDALKESKDKVKDKLNKSIDDFSNDLTSKFNSKMDEFGNTIPQNDIGNSENAKAATFTLNYKEYLYAFTYVGLIANNDNMLRRTAFVIQSNLAVKDPSFNIKNKYTMVSVTAEADVAATFLGVFENEVTPSGQSVSFIDDFFVNAWTNGQTTNKIKYNGVIGY